MTPLLDVSGLGASYGRADVLRDVSLQVFPGQIVTLIGPNGAGKTTTLNAIMGLIASRGSRRFQGQDMARASTEELVAAGIALVPETRALFADMSVEDNLILGFYQRWRHGHRDRAARLAEIGAIFPVLAERRRQPAGTLSGGERQMLALGRALMGRPTLLLLDEPSLGLAPRITRDIFAVLGRLKRDGLAILLVEQNALAALALADSAIVLELGSIAAAGPSATLATDPRVRETYLGRHRG
jgi:branched-chain amino acid transport system ATP-binding protein